MAFHEVLKQLRLSRELTQKQLADAVGLSQNTISMYENGRREPDMKILAQLGQVFGVDMNCLLDVAAPRAQDPLGELDAQDQRDIGKKLRSMLELFDSQEALMFDGEPIDQETRELLKESYRSQLELTKRLAKAKYGPKEKKT